MSSEVIVSVLMITYNHELYIKEAIEGVLMQKTNFPIELIIGEDFSTDSTREIVVEYANKYPEIIKAQLPNKNRGMSLNFFSIYEAAQGKYIALCEGDDYWTDPYKLQKQVDFLEANEEYSLCCHRYSFFSERTQDYNPDTNENLVYDKNGYFKFDQYSYFSGWYTQTLTVVFRRNMLDNRVFEQFRTKIDFSLFYSIVRGSKGCLMNFVGGVYRLHNTGVSTSLNALNHTKWHYEIGADLFKIENDSFTQGVAKANTLQYLYSYIKTCDNINLRFISKLSKEYASYSSSKNELINMYLKIIKGFILRALRRKYYKSILKKNY